MTSEKLPRLRERFMHALLACFLIATAYVAPFYLQRKLPRGHRNTVLFRTVSTLLACAVAWLPLALAVRRHPQVCISPVEGHACVGLRVVKYKHCGFLHLLIHA